MRVMPENKDAILRSARASRARAIIAELELRFEDRDRLNERAQCLEEMAEREET